MRLDRLDLTRYGRFTDHALDFGPAPVDGPDLHIVFGANEAGKSTAMAAWLDLLYGIEPRSRYAFLHPYDAMRVGATVTLAGGARRVARVKGVRDTLRGPDDRPLDDALFAADLAGIDRAAHRMMFSLDDATLEEGGDSILASRGELGALLFSATAGLSQMGAALDRLRDEADAFHKKRRQKTRLAEMKAELDALRLEAEALDVRADDYARRVTARDAAAARLAEAQGARLVGFAAAAQPAPIVAEGSAFAAGVWAEQAAEHERAARAAADAFMAAMTERGVPAEVRVVGGFEDSAGASLAVNARYADLTVIGARDAVMSRALADALIDGAVFDTGRPVLALPASGAGATIGQRPLLAWDGGPQAARAASDALPLLTQAAEVRIVVARTYFGMSRHGEEPGADIARWLAAHGANVSVEVLDPEGKKVADALAEAATRHGCDMIVMGAFGHSRLREAIFGGVTSDLLTAPPLPLFLAR